MATAVSDVQLAKAILAAVEDRRNTAQHMVAEFVSPRVKADAASGFVPRFATAHMRNVIGAVGPYDPSPRVDFHVDSTAFACKEYRRRALLPRGLEDMDDTKLLNAMVAKGLVAEEALMIERESLIMTMMTGGAAFYTIQAAPAVRWDAANATPADDVQTAIGTVDTNTNREAQYAVVSPDVARWARAFVAGLRVGGGSASLAPMSEVAAYFGLKEIRVARAAYDTTLPGNDTVTLAKIFPVNSMWVFYKPEQPSIYSPSWMLTPTFAPRGMEVEKTVFNVTEPVIGKAAEVLDYRTDVVVDPGACVRITTPLT